MADACLCFWASHQNVLMQVINRSVRLHHNLTVEPCSVNAASCLSIWQEQHHTISFDKGSSSGNRHTGAGSTNTCMLSDRQYNHIDTMLHVLQASTTVIQANTTVIQANTTVMQANTSYKGV